MDYTPLRVLVAMLFHLSWKSDKRPFSEQDSLVLRRDGLLLGALTPEANDVAKAVRQLLRMPEVEELDTPAIPRQEDEIEEFAHATSSFVQQLDELITQVWLGCSVVLTVKPETVIVEPGQSGRGKPRESRGFRVSIATMPETPLCIEAVGANVVEVAQEAVALLRKRVKEEEERFVQTQ